MFACVGEDIKSRRYFKNRLFVFHYAVNFRHNTRIHRSKADRRHARHNGEHWELNLCSEYRIFEQFSIFLKQPQCNSIGVIYKHSVCSVFAELGKEFVEHYVARGICTVGSIDAQSARKCGGGTGQPY